jgi:hypothetical protein
MASELIQKYVTEFPRGTPLVCACEKGRFEDVKSLMSPDGEHIGKNTLEQYVNQVGTDSDGYETTPLMTAAMNEHFHVVQYLITYGADPNIVLSDGYNALHFAAWYNRTNTELIQLLLTRMTLDSINKKTSGGYTPLDRAYSNNRSPIKQKIIDLIRSKGGKGNYYDASGWNAGEGNGDLNKLHFRF